jgi:hypothetical protein
MNAVIRSMPLLLALMAGCTYMETKRDNAPGGRMDQEKAAARQDLESARAQNTELSSASQKRRADIAAMNERIARVDADLRRQDQSLNEALKARRISQERYNQLKKQLDGMRSETQEIDLQNKGSAMAAPDAKADAAKQARMAELEKRKRDLEAALAQMSGK